MLSTEEFEERDRGSNLRRPKGARERAETKRARRRARRLSELAARPKEGPKDLRTWYLETGHTWPWLSRQTGVCVRTLKRVAAGRQASFRVASAIHRVTRISRYVMMEGTK